MFSQYFQAINRDEATTILSTKHNPHFIVRRCSEESDDNLTGIIDSESDNVIGFYYALSYIHTDKTIHHLKFKTLEIDLDTLNQKFEIYLNNLYQKGLFLYKPTLSAKKNSSHCELLEIHRNLVLRPEEVEKTRKIFSTSESKDKSGVLIISTQTPERCKDELKKQGAQPGKTGIELQRILSEGHFAQPWAIITGHGKTGTSALHGLYLQFTPGQKSIDLELTAFDYLFLLMQAGIKSGDRINIVLNVCHGGAREEKPISSGGKAKLETIPGTSFAEKLAYELAANGISSIIVASKTTVARFTGSYLSDERAGVSMKLRAKDSPESLRLVRGQLIDGAPEVLMSKNLPQDFIMSKQGIGFAGYLNVDLWKWFEPKAGSKNKLG